MVLTEIKDHCELLISQFDQIKSDRRNQLNQLALLCKKHVDSDDELKLLIVCTHNSRRSHFAEIWLQIAKAYYKLKNISFYSAGTEATAVFPQVLQSLAKVGVTSNELDGGNHQIGITESEIVHTVFSKRFDDKSIPKNISIAVMVCDDAAENCPMIPGVQNRFALSYKDPKFSDGTENQIQAYNLTRDEIGREMLYLISELT